MEIIKPFEANRSAEVSFFGTQVTTPELFATLTHNPNERGWHFGAGDPEFWRYSDRLLVPNGKLLDLGIGHGRSSMFFALHGMSVTGIEIESPAVSALQALVRTHSDLGLNIDVRNEDITKADLGNGDYDTVLMGQTTQHMRSKNEAFSVVERAIKALKPGGHLWLRTGGKWDSSFDELSSFAGYYPEVERIDEDTFVSPCGCSGEMRIEHQLFMDPVELYGHVSSNGATLRHVQFVPEYEGMNFMYGEDWKNGMLRGKRCAGITLIAEKTA